MKGNRNEECKEIYPAVDRPRLPARYLPLFQPLLPLHRRPLPLEILAFVRVLPQAPLGQQRLRHQLARLRRDQQQPEDQDLTCYGRTAQLKL